MLTIVRSIEFSSPTSHLREISLKYSSSDPYFCNHNHAIADLQPPRLNFVFVQSCHTASTSDGGHFLKHRNLPLIDPVRTGNTHLKTVRTATKCSMSISYTTAPYQLTSQSLIATSTSPLANSKAGFAAVPLYPRSTSSWILASH